MGPLEGIRPLGFSATHGPDEQTKFSFSLASVHCPHMCRALRLGDPQKHLERSNPFSEYIPVVSPFEFLHIQGSLRPRTQAGVRGHVVCAS